MIHITKRDRDMIQGVIDGKKNKALAFDLGLRENTVKVYMSRLFQKLKVADRWELGNWGRARAEAERLTRERFHELNPELPAQQSPTFANTVIAEYDVFRAMATTIELSVIQHCEIIQLLTAKGIHLVTTKEDLAA